MKKIFPIICAVVGGLLCCLSMFGSWLRMHNEHEHNYITTKGQYIEEYDEYNRPITYHCIDENQTLIVPSFKIDSCTICHKLDTTYIPFDLYLCPLAPYKNHKYVTDVVGNGYVIEHCKWCDLSRRNHFSNTFEYTNPFKTTGMSLSLYVKIINK